MDVFSHGGGRGQDSSREGMVARKGGKLVALHLFRKFHLQQPSFSNRSPYTASAARDHMCQTWEAFCTQTMSYRKGNMQ